MARKEKEIVYVCSECGHVESKWIGRCPECGGWNTFTEEKVEGKEEKRQPVMDDQVRLLSDAVKDEDLFVSSGFDELDRVLGSGVMIPSSVLVGGDPGIGKSTLMLEVLSNLSVEVPPVLYVSGEESPGQIRLRGERLGIRLDKINISCETRLERLKDIISKLSPKVMIIDSIQTLTSDEIQSPAGSPNQIRTATLSLSLLAKKIGCAVFFIGHITKDGFIAGPKIIEHMVDTVLYFENADGGLRLLRAVKNRFGSVDEIGLFEMSSSGLAGVKDTGGIFLSSREDGEIPPGIAFTPVVEGSRTFIVELQALVVPAKSGLQRIYSDKVEVQRVMRVAAILERHAAIKLSDYDIYVNVRGGLKIRDVSIELPLALALYSSKENKSIPRDLASFGELSLAGEVCQVPFFERKAKAARETGLEKVLCPYGKGILKSRDIVGVKNIKTALKTAFLL